MNTAFYRRRGTAWNGVDFPWYLGLIFFYTTPGGTRRENVDNKVNIHVSKSKKRMGKNANGGKSNQRKGMGVIRT